MTGKWEFESESDNQKKKKKRDLKWHLEGQREKGGKETYSSSAPPRKVWFDRNIGKQQEEQEYDHLSLIKGYKSNKWSVCVSCVPSILLWIKGNPNAN